MSLTERCSQTVYLKLGPQFFSPVVCARPREVRGNYANEVSIKLIRRTNVASVSLHQDKRASKLTAMNFNEEQLTHHAERVVKKRERIETLEALLATHEAMGTEPDSRDIKELKQRIRAARMQLMAMS